MYYCKKTVEIAGSHFLELDYDSKCLREHGHNWIINVYCKSKKLDKNGMVVDFAHIKDFVMKLDHKFLNDILPFNPTAENIASFICRNIDKCYKVEVSESRDNLVWYEREEINEHD